MRRRSRLLTGVVCLLSSGIAWNATEGGFDPSIVAVSTDQQPIPNVGPMSSYAYSFNEVFSGTASTTNPTQLFLQDFHNYYVGTGVNTIQYQLNGTLTGAIPSATVAFSSTVFSASSNASGGFVGFLGVNSSGSYSNAVVGPVVVANIFDPTNGTTLIGSITADFGSTKANDTTFTVTNYSSTYTFDPPYYGAIFTLNLDTPLIPGPAASSPEPSSIVMVGIAGLMGMGYLRRRRKAIAG